MTDDRVYLGDILERIERIEAYTQGGREAFLRLLSIQDGVIRRFEVIGEAVKRVSQKHLITHRLEVWGYKNEACLRRL